MLAQPLALVYRLMIALALWSLVGPRAVALRRPLRRTTQMGAH